MLKKSYSFVTQVTINHSYLSETQQGGNTNRVLSPGNKVHSHLSKLNKSIKQFDKIDSEQLLKSLALY